MPFYRPMIISAALLALTATIPVAAKIPHRLAPPPRSGDKADVLGPHVYEIPAITGAELTTYGARRIAVRIKLTHANVMRIGRDIQRATVTGSTSDPAPGPDTGAIAQPNFGSGKTTRLDIDLTPLNIPGHVVMYVITLDNAKLSFMADADYPIAAGDDCGTKMYRVLKKNLKDWTDLSEADRLAQRTIRFFSIPGQACTGSYNLGLTIRDGDPGSDFILPVWIDPKIKDNG